MTMGRLKVGDKMEWVSSRGNRIRRRRVVIRNVRENDKQVWVDVYSDEGKQFVRVSANRLFPVSSSGEDVRDK